MTSAILQWAGAVGVLTAFALSQRGRWAIDGRPYLVVNLVAGACLTGAAVLTHHWGYTFLEAVWTLVALRGIVVGAGARYGRRR
jgi:hypothetical protein